MDYLEYLVAKEEVIFLPNIDKAIAQNIWLSLKVDLNHVKFVVSWLHDRNLIKTDSFHYASQFKHAEIK